MNVTLSKHGSAVMLKTPQQVKLDFEARGETLRSWAEKRGYKPRLVYAVVQGKCLGKRGKAHHIAVELGLKAKPKEAALL